MPAVVWLLRQLRYNATLPAPPVLPLPQCSCRSECMGYSLGRLGHSLLLECCQVWLHLQMLLRPKLLLWPARPLSTSRMLPLRGCHPGPQ